MIIIEIIIGIIDTLYVRNKLPIDVRIFPILKEDNGK